MNMNKEEELGKYTNNASRDELDIGWKKDRQKHTLSYVIIRNKTKMLHPCDNTLIQLFYLSEFRILNSDRFFIASYALLRSLVLSKTFSFSLSILHIPLYLLYSYSFRIRFVFLVVVQGRNWVNKAWYDSCALLMETRVSFYSNVVIELCLFGVTAFNMVSSE